MVRWSNLLSYLGFELRVVSWALLIADELRFTQITPAPFFTGDYLSLAREVFPDAPLPRVTG